MKKHAILFILCFLIIIGTMPSGVFAINLGSDNFKKINTYVAGQFNDVKLSDWFSANVANAYELGLMIGSSDKDFNAYGNVTIAEAITMAARIHSIYNKGSDKFEKATLWYRPYLDYAVWNGVIDGEFPDYGKAATRAEFALILAGALPDEALTAINNVVDGSIPDVDINASYSSKLYKLYRAGILAGNDAYGMFTPDSNIARAAAAAIVTRMANPSLRIEINLKEAVQILYAADGRTRITLRSEVEAYLKVGWYKEPVVNMYSADGRSIVVKKVDIEVNKAVGWHECRSLKGHTWIEATCIASKTCSSCGLKEGLPLGHNYNSEGICTRCGEKIQISDITLSDNDDIVLTAEQIYARYSPAVFYIEVYDANKKILGSGSGFFIDSSGTAVTNYHVIKGASYAKIKTSPDGMEYDVAGVYDYSQENDLALLKVYGNNFKYLQTDDSDAINGGATIYAIGSPLGLENTISQGIISNTKRMVDDITYIQISAPISSGSSGGALFNDKGRVIGVTSAYFTKGQNLNLAIPINLINNFTRNNITDLPTLVNNTKLVRKVTTSVKNVTVNIGSSETIIIYTENMEDDDTLIYKGNDSNITLKWNDWIDDDTTSLTITGKYIGETMFSVELLENKGGMLVDVIFIHVEVVNNNQVYGYYDFPAVPDFGAYYGVNIFYQSNSISDVTSKNLSFYSYKYEDMPFSEAVTEYTKLLNQFGFTYDGYFYDQDDQKVSRYKNASINNFIYIGSHFHNNVFCVTMMIGYIN